MAKKIYVENQRFRSHALILMLVLLVLSTAIRFGAEVLEFGQASGTVMGLCLFAMIVLCGILWYLFQLQLDLAINKKGIQYKLKPWHQQKHKIRWEDIEQIEIVKTPALAQWHGGNITYSREKRYSVSGRNGLHLVTRDGQEYFLGSQKLTALKSAIEQVWNERN